MVGFYVSRHKGLRFLLNGVLQCTVYSFIFSSCRREWPWAGGLTKPNMNCLLKLEQKVEKLVFKRHRDAVEIVQSVKCLLYFTET